MTSNHVPSLPAAGGVTPRQDHPPMPSGPHGPDHGTGGSPGADVLRADMTPDAALARLEALRGELDAVDGRLRETLRDRLDCCARIGQLKAEPPDARERAGLLRSATVRLRDARQVILSLESRFDLAYNAAHAAALSALRQHGYRSDNRYLVFQSLEHTLGFTPQPWLLLSQAHKKRNLAEYEGELDVTAGFVDELIEHVELLLAAAKVLDVPPPL